MSDTYSPCPVCNTINRVRLDRAEEAQPVCAKCQIPLRLHGAVSEVSGAGLTALVEKTSRPVVADFWAEWCGPCKAFAPTFLEVASEHADKVTFVKLNTEEDPGASRKMGIQGIPTLIHFEGGKEKARRAGAVDARSFKSWLGV